MNNISRTLLILFILAVASSQLFAEEYRYENGKKQSSGLKETAAGCAPASAFDWLDVNNVRARINTGGDMWWDFQTAQYEVPKGSGKTAMWTGLRRCGRAPSSLLNLSWRCFVVPASTIRRCRVCMQRWSKAICAPHAPTQNLGSKTRISRCFSP